MSDQVFFSYVIPTIGRESLETAVNSILYQSFSQATFEIIVVNDSGLPLSPAEWHKNPHITIVNTHRSERSFARNSGAAVARGKYLAFLDDDDWILPGALANFYQLAVDSPDASWLYGGIQIVDENHKVLAEINSRLQRNCFAQIMGDAWAPIQSSMIKSEAFFAVGGYSPIICGTEDLDLCRRIAYYGTFANTSASVACLYRGQTWNTSTNYLRAPADTKYSRDSILARPGVLRRFLSSTRNSYWRGRTLKVYLSTLAYNIQKKRIFTAVSRIFFSLAVLAASLLNIASPAFWAGLLADHPPQTLHFVMRDYDKKQQAGKAL